MACLKFKRPRRCQNRSRSLDGCHSTIFKLLGVGALVLVLLIPLAMITGVLRERLGRRNEAVAEITSSWGREQNVIGPMLGIPYQYKFKTVKEVPAPDGKVERREVEETIFYPKH